jgi:hypothetical protein
MAPIKILSHRRQHDGVLPEVGRLGERETMSEAPVLSDLAAHTLRLYSAQLPAIIVEDDGTRRHRTPTLSDSAWLMVLGWLEKDGDPDRLRFELDSLTRHLPRRQVTRWAAKFANAAKITDPQVCQTLAEAVVYLDVRLRRQAEGERLCGRVLPRGGPHRRTAFRRRGPPGPLTLISRRTQV